MILLFDASFANKKEAVENVTPCSTPTASGKFPDITSNEPLPARPNNPALYIHLISGPQCRKEGIVCGTTTSYFSALLARSCLSMDELKESDSERTCAATSSPP